MSDHDFRQFVRGALSACLLLATGVCLPASAQNSDPDRHEGWNGTAGFGPIVFPKYTGGSGYRGWPIPLLSIDYNETFYVEIQRVGVYILASDDKKIGLGLAAEPRFGFGASDGPRLSGMATRRDSLEAGLTFDWDFDVVAFSVAAFGDVNRSSRGQSFRAAIYKPLLKNGHWDFGVLLGFDRLGAKVADYYFGVPASEATVGRPIFHPGAGTNTSLGISGTYNLDKRNAILFGAIATHLGGGTANSPIVEKRQANMFYLGYGWKL